MTHSPVFSQLKLHEYDPDFKREEEYWNVTTRLSDKNLAKFTRTLIRFHGKIHCSFVFDESVSSVGQMKAYLRISLPKGTAQRFMDESGLKLESPDVVSAN
jgi:hypothetical protein